MRMITEGPVKITGNSEWVYGDKSRDPPTGDLNFKESGNTIASFIYGVFMEAVTFSAFATDDAFEKALGFVEYYVTHSDVKDKLKKT